MWSVSKKDPREQLIWHVNLSQSKAKKIKGPLFSVPSSASFLAAKSRSIHGSECKTPAAAASRSFILGRDPDGYSNFFSIPQEKFYFSFSTNRETLPKQTFWNVFREKLPNVCFCLLLQNECEGEYETFEYNECTDTCSLYHITEHLRIVLVYSQLYK